MANNREEIQRIFDIQVDRIFRAINEQLTFFEDLMPSKQVVSAF